MFTGIVKGKATIESIQDLPGLRIFTLILPAGQEQGLEIGASIAVDGVCITVTSYIGNQVSFDVMQETLKRTTLGALQRGDIVNIERAAKDGVEIGGHPLSGHIDCVCSIEKIESPENNLVVTFKVSDPWMRYIFSKGYIALNGTSLTVSNVNKATKTFEVWFIPETLKVTTFSAKKIGDQINLEIERGTQVAVDTVREFMEERFGKLLPKLQKLLDLEEGL